MVNAVLTCIVIYPYITNQQDALFTSSQQPVNINAWHTPNTVYTE